MAEGLGCKGTAGNRADRRSGLALEQAKKLAAEFRVPVVVEVILERVTNISMGTLELDTTWSNIRGPWRRITRTRRPWRRRHAGLTMRIVIAPDKFKGSLPAAAVAAAITAGLRDVCPGAARLVTIPVADGGGRGRPGRWRPAPGVRRHGAGFAALAVLDAEPRAASSWCPI